MLRCKYRALSINHIKNADIVTDHRKQWIYYFAFSYSPVNPLKQKTENVSELLNQYVFKIILCFKY